ncbi:MAG: hypothetical protein HRU14_14840 [Planctomycetes bacterium]|nr:hypothetical protein [Planctomycetota bacterium]
MALLCAPAYAQPDVIVGDVTGPSNYTGSGGYDAFSLGTTSCNIGTSPLTWISSTNQHPVIGGNLYRYDPSNGGRFTMVGMSWLKHGFFALQQSLCSSCSANPNGSALGVGCSDPYTSSRNGGQSSLGPRSEVNASTGIFLYPPSNPSWSGSTDRRLKVPVSQLDPSSTYVSEAQYIQWEDAGAGADDNNASYRMSSISGGPTNYSLAFTAPTVREQAAINAWAILDPGVVLQTVQVPGADGGQLQLGVKRTDNGDGTWHFETCLHNLNCHDGIGGVSFTFANGVAITNQGFHSPEWHSNEVYNNSGWNVSTTSDSAVWLVGAGGANANVLRWSTAFSFWFDSDDPDLLGTNLDLHGSGGSIGLPAPPFPVEHWETNSPDAHLAIDGNATNDPFVGPIQVALASNVSHTASIGGTEGQPYELYLTNIDAVPSFYTSPGGEIVNLNLSHWSFVGFFGTPLMPAGGVNLGFYLPGTVSYTGQVWSADPTSLDGYSLSAATELSLTPQPRVVAESVGSHSYTADPDGFWRIAHNHGANIGSVALSFQGATGAAAGVFFDTDQGMPSGSGNFSQGNTYEQGSQTACGLDFSVSSPNPGSGWVGSDGTGGANFNTVTFQFTGGLFNDQTFRFNADTDGHGPVGNGGAGHAGMGVTVTFTTGAVVSGTLAADPSIPNRAFVAFQ